MERTSGTDHGHQEVRFLCSDCLVAGREQKLVAKAVRRDDGLWLTLNDRISELQRLGGNLDTLRSMDQAELAEMRLDAHLAATTKDPDERAEIIQRLRAKREAPSREQRARATRTNRTFSPDRPDDSMIEFGCRHTKCEARFTESLGDIRRAARAAGNSSVALPLHRRARRIA